MNKSEQAVLPKRSLKRFRSYWIIPLFLGAIVWSLCRPTAALAQSAPTTPLLQNMEQRWHWGGYISTMTVASDTLYVGMGQNLVLLDITEPAAPKFLGRLSLNAWLRDIEIVGDYALIAADSKGLFIVDVSDKQAPRLVAERHDPVIVKSIVVAAPYAYVAYQKYTATAIVNSIEILDVTHPEAPLVVNPQIIGIDDFEPNALQIANGYLFVAGGKFEIGRYNRSWGVFQAFYLTDPTAPTPLPAYRTEPGSNQEFYDLKLQGDIAYIARWDGIFQFAITTPATLPLSSFLHLETLAASTLTVIGDQLYVTKQATGVYILNASTSLTVTGSTILPQPVYKLAVQGHYAFVAHKDDGIRVGRDQAVRAA